jgi:hypothetical protein
LTNSQSWQGFCGDDSRQSSDRAGDGLHDANAGTYTLYVDGSAQKTVLQQAQGDPAAGPTAVGRAFSGGHNSDFWPGAIDQVHVWNRVLPSDEVNRLYLSGS